MPHWSSRQTVNQVVKKYDLAVLHSEEMMCIFKQFYYYYSENSHLEIIISELLCCSLGSYTMRQWRLLFSPYLYSLILSEGEVENS